VRGTFSIGHDLPRKRDADLVDCGLEGLVAEADFNAACA
jgi:hypothetical protein